MACLYLIQILTYILRMCLDEKRKRRSGYLDKQKVLKKGLRVLLDPKFWGKCFLCARYYDKHLGHIIRLQTIKKLTKKLLSG